MRGYRFLGVSNVISTLPKSFSHSAIHVSLCLHSDNVTGERIISVYSRRLRSVESITVRTRPGYPNNAESTCGKRLDRERQHIVPCVGGPTDPPWPVASPQETKKSSVLQHR